MLKNILLSATFAVSTITATQINLDLNLTISHEETKRYANGSVAINENEVTSIVFNGLESLIVDIVATQTEDNTVVIQTQLFQKMENEELVPMTDPLATEVSLQDPATFIINEEQGTGSLSLVIVPSLVE